MKKILVISLSVLILFSNMSFTMVTHYCMGMALKSKITVGHHNLNCGMDMKDMDHEDSEDSNHCCDNEFESLEVADDYQTVNTDYSLEAPTATVILLAYFSFIPVTVTEPTISADITPPPQLWDLQAMYQTFII